MMTTIEEAKRLTTLSGKDFSVIQFPQYLRILYLCYRLARIVLIKSGSKPFNSTKASVAAVRDLDHYKSYNMPSLCDDPLYAQTLRSVISAGPSDVWPLKHGRVIVFLEGRPFALAANNESLAAIARE
jgi:hypothetical protein